MTSPSRVRPPAGPLSGGASSARRFAYDLVGYHDEATAAAVLVGQGSTTGPAVRARLLEFAEQVEAAGSVRMAAHARRIAAEIPEADGAGALA